MFIAKVITNIKVSKVHTVHNTVHCAIALSTRTLKRDFPKINLKIYLV